MVVVIDCRPGCGTTEDHKLWRFTPVSLRNESARLKPILRAAARGFGRERGSLPIQQLASPPERH
jgi:hypothetical protein